MEIYEKYLNEGYKPGEMSDIPGLFNTAEGFVKTARAQYTNDYIKGGALKTLENLQKKVLKDLIKSLKEIGN